MKKRKFSTSVTEVSRPGYAPLGEAQRQSLIRSSQVYLSQPRRPAAPSVMPSYGAVKPRAMNVRGARVGAVAPSLMKKKRKAKGRGKKR